MKILIVDDESLARQRLRDLLADLGETDIVGEAANGSEAVEKTNLLKPDLLLIDIRMPVMDGLEAAMHLQSMENPPMIIFTTAYDQHALDAFEVNAVDYLLKPIRKERLETALKKARPITAKQLKEIRPSICLQHKQRPPTAFLKSTAPMVLWSFVTCFTPFGCFSGGIRVRLLDTIFVKIKLTLAFNIFYTIFNIKFFRRIVVMKKVIDQSMSAFLR